MSKKYLTADAPAIVTNDIFLASFLHCVGCSLDHVERNDRRRVSFVFTGEHAQELREAFRAGKVSLDIKLFRESMNMIRDRMDKALASRSGFESHFPEQRSVSHGPTKFSPSTTRTNLQTVPHY
jgi:hypothetical protein